MIIIKSGGCNHMTCGACKYQFCWLCNKKFTPDHFRINPMNPCGGRMFTQENRSNSFVCCQMCGDLCLYFSLPLILFFLLLFILPFIAYFKEYLNTLRRRRLLFRRGIHDNRLREEIRKETFDNVGRCYLVGLGFLSLLISPVTFVVLAIPFIILILIWMFCFSFILIWYFSVMYNVCCPSRVQENIRNAPVIRAVNR